MYYQTRCIMANFRKPTEFVNNLNNQFLRISQKDNLTASKQSREILHQKSFDRSSSKLKYLLQSLETPPLAFLIHHH